MNLTRVWVVLGLILAGSVLLEVLFVTPHSAAIWDTLPGFDSLFGLAGALVLILIAKGILGPLLQKPIDHYTQGGEDQ